MPRTTPFTSAIERAPARPAAAAFGSAATAAALVRQRTWHASPPAVRDGLTAWVVPLALLALWWLATRLQWVAPQVLPSPGDVALALQQAVISGELWPNIWISVLRVLGGFTVGLALGLPLGVAMGLSPTFKDYFFPLFKTFSQVPVLGWLPLLMLLVGIDESLKILLIAKAALVPITINTCQGVAGVPTRTIEVARVLRFNRWQLLSRVVFPAALAPIWTGVRYGLTNAWLALVVVELLASSEGLGYMIVYGRQLFQHDVVMAAMVVVGLAGWLLDRGLTGIEARLMRWRRPGF